MTIRSDDATHPANSFQPELFQVVRSGSTDRKVALGTDVSRSPQLEQLEPAEVRGELEEEQVIDKFGILLQHHSASGIFFGKDQDTTNLTDDLQTLQSTPLCLQPLRQLHQHPHHLSIRHNQPQILQPLQLTQQLRPITPRTMPVNLQLFQLRQRRKRLEHRRCESRIPSPGEGLEVDTVGESGHTGVFPLVGCGEGVVADVEAGDEGGEVG